MHVGMAAAGGAPRHTARQGTVWGGHRECRALELRLQSFANSEWRWPARHAAAGS